MDELALIFMLVYSGLFSLTLLIFTFYQFRLILKNLTSNESLRNKWNATRSCSSVTNIPSVWSRLLYYMWQMPLSESQLHGKGGGTENSRKRMSEILNEYGININFNSP
jgi:hypothetical protein